MESADPETYRAITDHFVHWDDIDVHYGGEVVRSTGHGFCGLSRKKLLQIFHARCLELGVELVFEHEVPDGEDLDADLIV